MYSTKRYFKVVLIFFVIFFIASCTKPVEENGVYTGVSVAYDALNKDVLDDIQEKANRKIHSIVLHVNFEYSFPQYHVEKVVEAGMIPHVVWQPWIWDDKTAVNKEALLNGEWDDYLTEFAEDVSSFQYPVFIQLAPLFNLENQAWSVASLGKDPEIYKAFYSYIHSFFENVGNVIWVWAPYVESYPNRDWNDIVKSYPGDERVDWVAVHGFRYSDKEDWAQQLTFEEMFSNMLTKFKLFNKPIMLASFGTVAGQESWFDEILPTLKTSFSFIKMLIYDDQVTNLLQPKAVPSEHGSDVFLNLLGDDYVNQTSDFLNQIHLDFSHQNYELKIPINLKKDMGEEAFLNHQFDTYDVVFNDAKLIRKGGYYWTGSEDFSASLSVYRLNSGLGLDMSITDDSIENSNTGSKVLLRDGLRCQVYQADNTDLGKNEMGNNGTILKDFAVNLVNEGPAWDYKLHQEATGITYSYFKENYSENGFENTKRLFLKLDENIEVGAINCQFIDVDQQSQSLRTIVSNIAKLPKWTP